MADVVYLHVGSPKTGTTYIQDRLALNRAALARHDVRYPIGLRADMFHAALDLVERPWGGLLADSKGEWDALVKRTRRAHGTVVISHEILAGATREQVERAVTSLAPAQIHVVLTARDIARQVPAEWQERLKHQRRLSYGKFVRRIQKTRTGVAQSFWQVQGVTQVLERWSRQLPPDQVHVVTVPQPGAPHGELWRRFCRAVGVDPAWAPLDSVRRNPSIGVAESAMLRRLNTRLRRADVDHADYRALVRQLLVHDTLAAGKNTDRLTLPPPCYDWADEIADSWREWIIGSGVDVVGDLDDLRPVRPPADAVWLNPDRARPRDVADAALDALVAMIEEAARRDDPDEHLSARVTKVAKRLRER
ncbi:hypothetical protein ASC77_13595 [Nocardioides sp. Root1257]|uniref:hypothetical protein n=1 Tax=unclassified Nocardioides TaxID=2615069 RepID=UPI0006FFE3F3|nr:MULTISPECIES: hypothetical protein [unclassified Nocardioides]KQW47484.1 hypothetical protein ASC77_13595 [Nocardioides sp. Root1257]KRC45640.1 hypothetical protein ASE24_13600 [Nocardioides sp. Root224]